MFFSDIFPSIRVIPLSIISKMFELEQHSVHKYRYVYILKKTLFLPLILLIHFND